jgi:syntaxin 5
MIQNDTALDMEIIASRGQAIEGIESTIAELGQIYQNFAVLLSSQREAVQRIDENVLDTQVSVEGAYGQLTKYYQGVQGNRWLVAKVLATMVFFFMIFVVFMN